MAWHLNLFSMRRVSMGLNLIMGSILMIVWCSLECEVQHLFKNIEMLVYYMNFVWTYFTTKMYVVILL